MILSEEEDTTTIEEVESTASITASSSSETLEELMDQMDIELSDHEGEEGADEGKGEGSEGEVEEIGGIGEREGVGMSEKIESSTHIHVGLSGEVGEKERMGAGPVRTVEKEGGSGVVGGRRRKHSSTYEKANFVVISMEKQLPNEDIVELMNLLQVRTCT